MSYILIGDSVISPPEPKPCPITKNILRSPKLVTANQFDRIGHKFHLSVERNDEITICVIKMPKI